MTIRGIGCVILFSLVVIACTQTATTTLVTQPSPTLFPTPTPAPQIRVTPLKPGENPWRVLAGDQSPVVNLLTAHPTQPGWIYAVPGHD